VNHDNRASLGLDSRAPSDEGPRIASDSYTAQVERAVEIGRPLSEIQEKIDSWPLQSDRRDALWLLAWAMAEQADERRPPNRFTRTRPTDD
jgi:hypothetical protein